jgi:hypothetical protein
LFDSEATVQAIALAVEEPIDLEDEILMVLVPGAVIGIWIEDQLGFGHVLHEMQ